ncbi:MAG: hypothetical protein SPL53_09930, partial [Bacteroidales bacterium]|nr:hypothetical protein [Bacteroidales bacterium]
HTRQSLFIAAKFQQSYSLFSTCPTHAARFFGKACIMKTIASKHNNIEGYNCLTGRPIVCIFAYTTF